VMPGMMATTATVTPALSNTAINYTAKNGGATTCRGRRRSTPCTRTRPPPGRRPSPTASSSSTTPAAGPSAPCRRW
jgi:hypothetical protein